MRNRVFIRVMVSLCFSLVAGVALGQYPATGNKQRLGFQTTGDGLVYRGAIGDTATIDPVGIANAWMLIDTATGFVYAYRGYRWQLVTAIPYMPFDSVTFNDNQGDADSAELKYNADIGSLIYGGNDGAQIPVLPGHWYVRNDDTITLTKGTVVMATGTLGASGRILAKRMVADGSVKAMYILGIVAKDIPVGEDGYVMWQGKIRKLNTNAYAPGTVLYADWFTPGGLTDFLPAAPNLKLPIAFVVHQSTTSGVIAVRVTAGEYLTQLHDVDVGGVATNDILRYNGSTWVEGKDTSIYDYDAYLKNNRNVLLSNYSITFRDSMNDLDNVQIRDTYVAVRNESDSLTQSLSKFGLFSFQNNNTLQTIIHNYNGGIRLRGHTSATTVPEIDPDFRILPDGKISFRYSAGGSPDSLYAKNTNGYLTAVPNTLGEKLNISDTASMLSTYLSPSEILAGTGITLSKDSTVTISAPTTLSSSTAIIDIAEVVVDALNTLRLPWDGTAVVGIIKTGLYLTSGVNEAFVQHELIPNGDKGDITTSAGGATMAINAGAVTSTNLAASAVTEAKIATGAVRAGKYGINYFLSNTGGVTVVNYLNGTISTQRQMNIYTYVDSTTTGSRTVTLPKPVVDWNGIEINLITENFNNSYTGNVNLVTDSAGAYIRTFDLNTGKWQLKDVVNIKDIPNVKLLALNIGASYFWVAVPSSNIDTLNKIATKADLTLKLNAADTASLSTRIDAKQNTIAGAATTITTSNLTASRALVSDGSGKVAVSSVTATELGYLSGVTSSIQTQLNGKQNTLTNPITGTGTTNEIAFFNGSTTLSSLTTATYPSLTELSYVKGVTSAIQTQLNAKLNATDTASLSNRINLKLNAADTASLSNRIDLKLNAADTASLSNRIDTKLNAADTASLSNRINAFPVTYEYTTVMTDSLVTIPSGCKTIEIVCIGGGGGGGSGRRGVASGQTIANGGNGGTSGAYSFISLDASAITAQLKITVGAGGTGGAARTTNDTDGANGTNGGASSVYTGATGSPANALLIYAGGGGYGGGGSSPGFGTDTVGEKFFGDFPGNGGGLGNGTDGPNIAAGVATTKTPTGGGGGGRITASTTENNGGNGGAPGYAKISNANKGTTATPNATAGYTPVAGQSFGGGGGGGGASKASGAGGNGGNGVRGGGGGGGGASVNGVNSGAGGNGGTGYVRITFY